MPNKLIVLSFDALQSNDVDVLARLPYCSEAFKRASIVKSVREVYPTLTYPIHTSIITGVKPAVHGIFHNQRSSIQPECPDWNIMGSDWYWEKASVKVPTLVDAVWASGREAATVSWPVTAGDTRGVNLPEIWPSPGKDESPRALFERAASPRAMELFYDKYYAHFDWSNNEDLVEYAVEAGLDVARTLKPDLLLCHVVHLDHFRHMYGDQGREVDVCLRMLDVIAGRFIQATLDASTYDETNFVILGDHGQIDIEALFNLNVPLREAGLIDVDERGDATGYRAYGFSAGFSAHVNLMGGGDPALRDRVRECLLDIQARYPQYIERIYTAEEVLLEEGLAGDFSFVVEGTRGTQFENALTGPVVIPRSAPEYHSYAANHGHHPDKGMKPPFIAFGPDVLEGVRIDRGDMMDVCPTLAALAGADMPGLTGKPFPILK
jgi:predicted AlkP superfamily pyrophosphatase or phosphodiesterase